jgi:hypothetical protein
MWNIKETDGGDKIRLKVADLRNEKKWRAMPSI